jgi:SAM-dependent methyltransferase
MSVSGNGHGGYDPAFFRQLEFVEDRHFWFRARRRAVAAILKQITGTLPPNFNALELGCGNGGMLRLMQQCCTGGKVFGMDLFAEALTNAHRRVDVPLVQGDVRLPPFSQSLHLVTMFDVLEHLDDDLGILKHVHSMLVPGGALMLTVPAHMTLWSYFDEAANHVRRYAGADLRRQLRAAGFTIEYQTQFMATIYPLVWLGRRLNYHVQVGRRHLQRQFNPRELTENDFRIVPGLNRLLDWSLAGEENLIRSRRRITRGTSILAVARRR